MTTKPQDHKQPKDKPRRIEVMGATLTIDPSILDDLDMAEYEAVPAADSEHGSVALVHTGNIEARFDNAENNTLLHTM